MSRGVLANSITGKLGGAVRVTLYRGVVGENPGCFVLGGIYKVGRLRETDKNSRVGGARRSKKGGGRKTKRIPRVEFGRKGAFLQNCDLV